MKVPKWFGYMVLGKTFTLYGSLNFFTVLHLFCKSGFKNHPLKVSLRKQIRFLYGIAS